MRKSRFGLSMLAVLLGVVAGAQDKPPAENPKPPDTPQEPAVTEPPPPAADADEAAEEAKAPKRFVPTDRSTADNSATFPVDI